VQLGGELRGLRLAGSETGRPLPLAIFGPTGGPPYHEIMRHRRSESELYRAHDAPAGHAGTPGVTLLGNGAKTPRAQEAAPLGAAEPMRSHRYRTAELAEPRKTLRRAEAARQTTIPSAVSKNQATWTEKGTAKRSAAEEMNHVPVTDEVSGYT